MLPVFHLREKDVGGTTGVVGIVTRTTHGREDWVGDGWIGFLKAGPRLIAGRWHRRGDLWEFAPEDADDLNLISAQPKWEVLDGYWGERAGIVLDQTRRWDKARFEPRDAIQFRGPSGIWLKPASGTDDDSPKLARAFPGETASAAADASGTEVIKAGWDHEHCAICWETLGPGGQAEGYVSAEQTWVCERCYVDFVERRSLDFIPSV
jgi:hypothetical protein